MAGRATDDPIGDEAGSVLVVDDVRANRFVLERTLSQAGCTVTSVDNGQDALRLAKESPPDLALVDVMMPGINGYEVCARLKEDPRTANVPVIMVTALSEIEDLETSFDAGAMDYIARPFNPRELIVRVRNALRLKHQEDRLRRFQSKVSMELSLAGSLQKTMLAIPPLVTDVVQVSTAYRPSLKVSGDVFDRVVLGDGRLCVYMADVAGHGVAAAMVSSLLKATMTEVLHVAGAGCSPSTLCNEIDIRFRRTVKEPSMYATLVLGICDPSTSQWQIMNCGHPSPVLLSRTGDASWPCVKGGSVPIGFSILGDEPYCLDDEAVVEANPGDVLMFYTDGLTESRHGESDMECGVDGLGSALRNACRAGARLHLSSEVMRMLDAQGYDLSRDDCSGLTVEMLSSDGILYDDDIPASLDEISTAGIAVEEALCGWGWPSASAAAVRLTIVEYGNNTVIHGGIAGNQMLHLRVQFVGDLCNVTVRDSGPAWDYPTRDSVSRMPGVEEEGGRGIPIVFRVAQNPLFYRDRGQNVLALSIGEDCGEKVLEEEAP
jgi:sigma-B regulation protein RsbU (phosphoserine phosphatase)